MNRFEEKVYRKLLEKYPSDQWIVFPQLRTNTGLSGGFASGKTIDFFIINLWPSKDFKCISIEAKCNFADFMNDLKNPLKQAVARFYSDEFYYLVTEEIFQKKRVEIMRKMFRSDAGLLVFNEDICLKRRANNHTKSPFSMHFIASLLRNARNNR